MTVLEIDCGNSRIKYRLRTATVTGQQNQCLLTDFDRELSKIHKTMEAIEQVKISSVLNDDKNQFIAEKCKIQLGINPAFATIKSPYLGLDGCYGNIGVDRWLAMLAAFYQHQTALMVISAGTAMTLDVVDINGSHCGGYIVPGLRQLHEVLLKTDRISIDDNSSNQMVLGDSTSSCIYNGCLQMSIALINQTLHQALEDNPTIKLILCGGNAPTLLPFLKALSPHHCDNLILDGLSLILN